MHLFPRHVKQKQSANSSTAVGASSRALVTTDQQQQQVLEDLPPSLAADPNRKVFLTTINRQNPLHRLTREINRSHKSCDTVVETRKRDEDKELVYSCTPDTATFNLMLKTLPKRNKYVVQLVLDRMHAERIPMDATTYNLLLEKVVDLKDELVFQIYEAFKDESQKEDSSVRPDLQTYHCMMRACERNGQYERAFHLYSHMKELLGIYPDVAMYNILIGFCTALGDESQAAYIVEEMKDRGVEPDVHTYNCLMNVFANAPYEVIAQAFEDMLKRKVRPNRRTYNTLMKACQRISDYDRAFQYFEELKKEGLLPDVVTYNILLVMCRDRLDFVFGTGAHRHIRRTKEQKELGMKAVAELSMSLFAEMDEVEVVPNTYTYNALLSVLSRCLDLRVYEVFNQMKTDVRVAISNDEASMDDVATTWVAESASNNLSVSKLLSAPEADEGIDEDPAADARITGRRICPNLETFKIMIDASSRLRFPDKAYAIFDEMKDRRIKPTKDVYVKLIDVSSIKGEKNKAFQIFDEAKLNGERIDIDMYSALMNVLAQSQDPMLFELFQSLKEDKQGLGIHPTRDTYNILLQGCYHLKHVQKALAIHKEMCEPTCPVSPDTVTYGILMDICSLEKDVKLASNLILDMKARGVPPTINTYCRLMNVFVQADDEGAVDVFEDIKRHGPAPNFDAYVIILQFYLARKSPKILAVFDDLKSSTVEPDLEAYNILLEYCAIIGNHQKAFKYFEELKTRGLTADIETYNALLKVFAPTGSEYVYKVFEEMAECKIAPNHVTFSILMKHKAGRQCLTTASEQQLIYVEGGRR
jgi:pentatricopeptide repeat protein